MLCKVHNCLPSCVPIDRHGEIKKPSAARRTRAAAAASPSIRAMISNSTCGPDGDLKGAGLDLGLHLLVMNAKSRHPGRRDARCSPA